MDCLPIPLDGNCYVASEPSLEGCMAVDAIKRSVYGEMEIQAGFCNGQGHTLNALEYHRCSEVNYSSTGLVLLLGLQGDIINKKVNSQSVKGFYLPAGVMVEILPQVLHFAPCRINSGGFNCLVVLEKGVNTPLDTVNTAAAGEEAMLWMRGKWMLCHGNSPQAEKGAYVGIYGENIELKV